MGERALRFGKGGCLFGVSHEPAGQGGTGVVFCPPFAEEKKCSYRTFLEAGRAFFAAGVACLRVDYFGTGDSGGSFADWSPSRAVDDIAAAADELRQRCGTERLVLLGLRLGGPLALDAAPRVDADSVVLWQPVISGAAFFDLTIKRQMLRKQLMESPGTDERCSPVRSGEHLPDDMVDLDGYGLSARAGEEIRSLDCGEAASEFGGPIHLFQISHTESVSREHSRLADAVGDRLTITTVRCPPFWNRIDLADTSAVVEKTLSHLLA